MCSMRLEEVRVSTKFTEYTIDRYLLFNHNGTIAEDVATLTHSLLLDIFDSNYNLDENMIKNHKKYEFMLQILLSY